MCMINMHVGRQGDACTHQTGHFSNRSHELLLGHDRTNDRLVLENREGNHSFHRQPIIIYRH